MIGTPLPPVLADIADFPSMNAVWDAWVPAGHTPALRASRIELRRARLWRGSKQ